MWVRARATTSGVSAAQLAALATRSIVLLGIAAVCSTLRESRSLSETPPGSGARSSLVGSVMARTPLAPSGAEPRSESTASQASPLPTALPPGIVHYVPSFNICATCNCELSLPGICRYIALSITALVPPVASLSLSSPSSVRAFTTCGVLHRVADVGRQ